VAGLGANPAMIVHRRVLLAFVGAKLTRQHARVELRMHKFIGRFGLAHQNSSRRATDVGAIEIRADTASKVLESFLLAQTSVGARRARRGAGRQSIQCFDVIMRVLRVGAGVTMKH
jgi:hypothetical protein